MYLEFLLEKKVLNFFKSTECPQFAVEQSGEVVYEKKSPLMLLLLRVLYDAYNHHLFVCNSNAIISRTNNKGIEQKKGIRNASKIRTIF